MILARLNWLVLRCLPSACLILAFGLTACRSSRRGVRSTSDSVKLEVTINGLDPQDKERPDWVYEMSGCVQTINGVRDDKDEDVVAFKSVGLRTGVSGCQLRVRTLRPLPNTLPAIAAEPDVAYWSRDFSISQTPNGKLVSRVNVTKTYATQVPAGKGFTLKVPVRFPSQETNMRILARLDCTPALKNPGIYPAGNPETGEFVFAGTIEKGTDFKCKKLTVEVDGTVKYFNDFTGTSGDFSAAGDQTVSLKQATLSYSVEAGKISVDIKPGDCGENEIYNADKNECEKKK